MENAKVVIGANFGDEGKGLMTDYLASLQDDTVVARFSGGAQASHTVQTPKGLRHVFSHIPAGAYMGHPGFLSEHFVANPMLLRKELKTIVGKPTVYVDRKCLVTTPIDMLINQGLEAARAASGTGRHGSCGIGINETVTRSQSDDRFVITVDDMGSDGALTMKFERILTKYLPKRMEHLGLDYGHLPVDPREVDVLGPFLSDVNLFREVMLPAEVSILQRFKQVIFEGSQGLLLDELSPFFPHVTRARTGLTNVIEICRAAKIRKVDVVYVSRCYLTRHGVGPLPNEVIGRPIYPGINDKTNVWNPYQGSLRFAPLNLDLLGHAIGSDLAQAKDLVADASMAITCLDQLPGDKLKVILGGKESEVGIDELKKTSPIKYVSYGPSRSDVKMLNGHKEGRV